MGAAVEHSYAIDFPAQPVQNSEENVDIENPTEKSGLVVRWCREGLEVV